MNCGEGGSDDPATSANATVYIIGNNHGELEEFINEYSSYLLLQYNRL